MMLQQLSPITDCIRYIDDIFILEYGCQNRAGAVLIRLFSMYTLHPQ